MKPPQHRENPNITKCQQYAISKHSKNLESKNQNFRCWFTRSQALFSFIYLFKDLDLLTPGFFSFSLYCSVHKTTEIALRFSTFSFIWRAETLGFPHDSKKHYGVSRVSLQAVVLPVVPCRFLCTPGPSRWTAQGITRKQNNAQRSDTNFQAQHCSTTRNNNGGKLQWHIKNCS